MARTRFVTVSIVLCGFLTVIAPASAVTLGDTSLPGGGTSTSPCSPNAFYTQAATDSSYDYAVPAGGGAITSWSTNTTNAAVSTPLALLVLRRSGPPDTTGSSYRLVGFDTETLPNPLPASGVATFDLASPINASAGDLIGLYSFGTTGTCNFFGGTGISMADAAAASLVAPTPAAGATYTASVTSGPALVNVAATLIQSEDVGVTGTATPTSITAGSAASYSFAVSNAGPGSATVTVSDVVPPGLKILAAVAGSGTCATISQAVTCTITGLASGSTSPVSIVVTAAAAGSYPDSATVSASLPDPNPANNSITTTLTVTAAAPGPSCKVIPLARVPLAAAKTVISALGCTVGKVTKKASKKVPKGDVISTSPGPGKTLAAGTKVNITVSSGPPKKKGKKK